MGGVRFLKIYKCRRKIQEVEKRWFNWTTTPRSVSFLTDSPPFAYTARRQISVDVQGKTTLILGKYFYVWAFCCIKIILFSDKSNKCNLEQRRGTWRIVKSGPIRHESKVQKVVALIAISFSSGSSKEKKRTTHQDACEVHNVHFIVKSIATTFL